MIHRRLPASWAACAVLATLGLLLAACLILPGKFDSELNLRRDGTFSFHYKGEIFVLALSKAFNSMTDPARNKPFEPTPCTDAKDNERPCSPAEIAEQRKAWQRARDEAAKERGKAGSSANDMLGGIDPADPKANEEFARRLARQSGWQAVVAKGDGKFEVDYAIAGRLDHDFSFPLIERTQTFGAFVTVIRRNDGTVRIDAPAFGNTQSASAKSSEVMGGMLGRKEGSLDGPVLDGHFTVRTDAAILANNTDEGPKPDGAGQRLDWQVNAQSPAPPTALLKM